MKTKQLLFGAMALMMALPLSATTWYVRSATGNDTSGDGSIGSPWATFSSAYGKAAVQSGDILDVSGTFTTDYGRSLSKSITIQGNDKTTAIFDGAAGNATMKNFANMTTTGVTVDIENVTFQNYNNYNPAATAQGGVLSIQAIGGACNVTLKNCIFKDNASTNGGAVQLAYASNLTIEDCYFVGNSAKDITVSGSTTSGSGGALYVSTSTNASAVSINRCLFDGNKAYGGSGSALIYQSSAVLNTAAASLTITNSTFTGNTQMYNSATTPAVSDGIINLNPTGTGVEVKLINNTIAYNSSARTTTGGTPGLYVRGTANLTTLINNILFSNFDSQATPVSTSIGSNVNLNESRNNITDVASGTFNWTTKTTNGASGNVSGISNGTLNLATSLADNGGATKTLALSAGSSAISAGYVTGAPAVDQRNFSRDGIPDVGAYGFSIATAIVGASTQNGLTVTPAGVVANENGKMSLYTISGVLVKELPVTNGQIIPLPKGTYILRFITKQGVAVQKIIL